MATHTDGVPGTCDSIMSDPRTQTLKATMTTELPSPMVLAVGWAQLQALSRSGPSRLCSQMAVGLESVQASSLKVGAGLLA